MKRENINLISKELDYRDNLITFFKMLKINNSNLDQFCLGYKHGNLSDKYTPVVKIDRYGSDYCIVDLVSAVELMINTSTERLKQFGYTE